jgi:hypothetical protein
MGNSEKRRELQMAWAICGFLGIQILFSVAVMLIEREIGPFFPVLLISSSCIFLVFNTWIRDR